MASKKAIVIIAVIVVVIAIIAIAASAGSDDEPDVRYDYDAYLSDTLGSQTAPEGQQFLVIDYALANDGDEEISTNYMYADWTATLDGITYTASAIYSVSADGYQLIHIQPGAVGTSASVILVPTGYELSDFQIGYDLDDFERHNIAYDDTLL